MSLHNLPANFLATDVLIELSDHLDAWVGSGRGQSLLPILGTSRTLELVHTARPLGAEEAVRLGIVHILTTPDALLPAAQEVAEQISRRPAAPVRAIKGSVYRHDRTPHRRAARFEQLRFYDQVLSHWIQGRRPAERHPNSNQ